MARWEEQLKGLVVLERHCLTLREEVEHLSEGQEVLADLMEGKMNMQKTAPVDFQRQIFQEPKEVEEQSTKEELELVHRKHKLIKWEGERERGQGPCKGWSRQGQWDSGPEPTTIPPLVRLHLPWPLTRHKTWMRRSPNRLGLRWQK